MSYYFIYNFNDFYENSINKEWTIYSKVPRIRREKNQKTGYWEYSKIDLNREFEDLFTKYNFDPKKENILEDIKSIIKNNDNFLIEKKEFDGKQKNFYERFIYLFNLILQIRNTYSLSIEVNESGKLAKIDYGIDFIASAVKPFLTTQGINKIVVFNENGKEEKKLKIESEINFDIFEKKFITENSKKI